MKINDKTSCGKYHFSYNTVKTLVYSVNKWGTTESKELIYKDYLISPGPMTNHTCPVSVRDPAVLQYYIAIITDHQLLTIVL